MTYRVTVTLGDEEYARPAEEAARRQQPVESLVRDVLGRQFLPAEPAFVRSNGAAEQALLRAGLLAALPTHEVEPPEETAERERLALDFSRGQAVSALLIEDRGPR